MTDYVCVATGDWNTASTWDVGSGYPGDGLGASDTATIGAYTVTAPASLTISAANAVALATGGTAINAKARLVNNGTLNLTSWTMNAFTRFTIGAGSLLDTSGGNFNITSSAAGRYIFDSSATSTSRGVVDLGGGNWERSGFDVKSYVHFQYVDFKNLGNCFFTIMDYGSTLTDGDTTFGTSGAYVEDCIVEDCTLNDGVAVPRFGGARVAGLKFIFRRNDVVGWTGTYGVYLADYGGASRAGTKDLSHNTFKQAGGTIRVLGYEFDLKDSVLDDVVVYAISSIQIIESANLYRLKTQDLSSADGDSIKSSYIATEKDNPHTLQGYSTVTNNVIQVTYSLGYTDDGDHALVSPLLDQTFNYNIILEEKSGVFLNALGSARSKIYNVNHNTLYGNYNAYGSLARNEAGGSFTGALSLHDNLIINKAVISGSLGFNLTTVLDDQVTAMDNNGWYQIETKYSGVTSATKTAGVTAGYGGNDIEGNPEFFAPTRKLETWDAANGSGTGTVDAAVTYMLGINGYDSTNKTQVAANAVSELPSDIVEWVSAGLAPQNVIYNGTASDSTDVGAVAYSAASGTLKTGSGVLISNPATIAGTGQRKIKATGALASNQALIVGAGKRKIIATGLLQSNNASILGAGIRTIKGAGALISGMASISGNNKQLSPSYEAMNMPLSISAVIAMRLSDAPTATN